MNLNKQIGTAAALAQMVWVACGIFLYLTTPGASLLSGSAAAFFVGGFFAAAALFGTVFYGLQRGLDSVLAVPAGVPAARPVQTTSAVAWSLAIAEAVVVFVAADWAFRQLETFRAGVPVEYVQQRDDFDYALKAFSVASRLEEQAKPGRDSGQIDADIETRLVELMEAGVARARGVSDAFLIYLDPELPQPFRTQLIRGHELLVEGRRSGDVAKQTEGNELVRAFYQDFLPRRADAIIEKMGLQAQ